MVWQIFYIRLLESFHNLHHWKKYEYKIHELNHITHKPARSRVYTLPETLYPSGYPLYTHLSTQRILYLKSTLLNCLAFAPHKYWLVANPLGLSTLKTPYIWDYTHFIGSGSNSRSPTVEHWNSSSVILSQKTSVHTTCQCTHPLFLPNDYVTPLPALCVIFSHIHCSECSECSSTHSLFFSFFWKFPLPLYTNELHFCCSPHSLWMHATHIYIYIQTELKVPYYSWTVHQCSRIVHSFCFIPFVCHSLCLQQHVILHHAMPSYSTFAACFVTSCFATTFMYQWSTINYSQKWGNHTTIYIIKYLWRILMFVRTCRITSSFLTIMTSLKASIQTTGRGTNAFTVLDSQGKAFLGFPQIQRLWLKISISF